MPRAHPFTLLYDSACPFCRLEGRFLTRLDRGRGRIALIDIAAPGFDPSPYGRSLDALMGSLHGVTVDGTLTSGMQTFRLAYAAVGMGWVLAPTGWPVLRPVFDVLYRLFARHRVRFGRLFGRRCDNDRCAINTSPPASASTPRR